MKIKNIMRGFYTLIIVVLAVALGNCSNVEKLNALIPSADSNSLNKAALKLSITGVNSKNLNLIQGHVVVSGLDVHAQNGDWITLSQYSDAGKAFDFMAGEQDTFPVDTFSLLPGVYDGIRIRLSDGQSEFLVQDREVSSWHKLYTRTTGEHHFDRQQYDGEKYAERDGQQDKDDLNRDDVVYTVAGNTLTTVELTLDLKKTGLHNGLNRDNSEHGGFYDHDRSNGVRNAGYEMSENEDRDADSLYMVKAKLIPVSISVSELPVESNWIAQNSQTSNSLLGVVDTGAEKMGVGAYGTILSSVDGASWIQEGSPVSINMNAIANLGSNFVAVGDGGIILNSSFVKNQRVWTYSKSLTVSNLNSINCVSFGCVAVGDSGQTLFSPDGIRWINGKAVTQSNLHSVVWTGKYFIATGDNGVILNSIDGRSWNVIPLNGITAGLLSSAFSSQTAAIVVVGSNGTILYSPDLGRTIQQIIVPVQTNLNAVAFDGQRFIVVGDAGVILTSGDGISWKQEVAPIGTNLRAVSGTTDATGKIHDEILGDAGSILTSR